MVTVTETITRAYTVEPEPMDVFKEQEFHVQYTRTAGHLCWDWLMLLGFGAAFVFGTAIVLKRKDVG
jgi:hypothetical protein